MTLRPISVALLVGIFLTTPLLNRLNAQTATSGGLTGVVTDQSGAVLVNADVEITDINKGTIESTKTDREGYIVFLSGSQPIHTHCRAQRLSHGKPECNRIGSGASHSKRHVRDCKSKNANDRDGRSSTHSGRERRCLNDRKSDADIRGSKSRKRSHLHSADNSRGCDEHRHTGLGPFLNSGHARHRESLYFLLNAT